MSPTGAPTALEHAGRLQRVVECAYRMDLQIAFCERDVWRAPWKVELQDGTLLTVYHDLTRGGWYELTSAEIASLGDAVAIAAQKLQRWEAEQLATAAGANI